MSVPFTSDIREFNGPAGKLEARLDAPETKVRASVVFAHPHPQQGGTMHNKVVYRASKSLLKLGCAVLRFNFRGVGRSDGSFDQGRGETNDFSAGLDWMSQRFSNVPLWAAGFSFGAWVALHVGSVDPRVKLLLGIALPIKRDLDVFRESTKPKFLIHGESDDLISLQDTWLLYGQLAEPKELVVIDGADHIFDGKVLEVGDAIEDLLGDYGT